jgi:hypothetical protein
MLSQLFTIIVTVSLVLLIVTLVIGEWRHIAGVGFASALHLSASEARGPRIASRHLVRRHVHRAQ